MSGPISGIVTWTPAGSPYWIEGRVNVTAGSTLYVYGGVQVLFDRSSVLGTTLGVFGSLQALGTVGSPVVFAPNATQRSPNDAVAIDVAGSFLARNATVEAGILSAGGADSFMLDRVHLAQAPAITSTILLTGVRTVSITRSEIVNISGNGIDERGGSSLNISSNVFRSSPAGRSHAISTQTPDARILGNLIEGFEVAIEASGDRASVVGNDVNVNGCCGSGIQVGGADAIVIGNRIRGVGAGYEGIGLTLAPRATVRRNDVSGTGGWGIWVDASQNVDVTGNTVVSNALGIDVSDSRSTNATVAGNTIRGNGVGIRLRSGQFHRAYRNWIVDNAVQAYDSTGSSWDDGYPSGGNHWSDYIGDDVYQGAAQNIPGPDGIGDTPRPVAPNGVDRYPFYVVPAPGVPRNLTAHAVGRDMVLTWQPASRADDYLLYAADTPTGFTFTSPVSLGNVTTWTDAGAAATPGERYYVVRARNATWNRAGPTGNTAGKWTVAFPAGTSTMSLPFEYYPWVDYSTPGWIDTAGEFVAAAGASTIAYMDSGGWRLVPGGGDPSRTLRLGEGYTVTLPAAATFTFTGLPGSMIDYAGWPPYALAGFDPATSARVIAATVDGDDVVLTWGRLPGFGLFSNQTYEVYAAPTPWGLRGSAWTDHRLLATVPATGMGPASFVHAGALRAGSRWFYLVVPVQGGLWRGPSSFSVGVMALALPSGYSAIGLPLRPYASGTHVRLDVSSVASGPGVRGVLWYDPTRGDWVAHAAWMPPGTYDGPFVPVMAVQVDASSPTRITVSGV